MTPRKVHHPNIELQIAPMIDVCFLLLFFYILTAKTEKKEADISTRLPATVQQEESLDIPDEQRIEIKADGSVILNEQPLAAGGDAELPGLFKLLERFRESTEANKSSALVSLAPDDAVPHQRIIDVMNVCARAGIKEVTFAAEPEDEEGAP